MPTAKLDSQWTRRTMPIEAAAASILLLSNMCLAEEYCFGYYELQDGVPHAVLGETWTFDHDAPDPLEGWTPAHVFGPDEMEIIRWRTASDFADDGLPPGAPIIDGTGMIWAGLHESEASELCYECGLGYGTSWSQVLRSAPLAYAGGSVTLTFDYFTDADYWQEFFYEIHTLEGVARGYDYQVAGHGSWDDPQQKSVIFPSSTFIDSDSFRVALGIRTYEELTDQDCSYDSGDIVKSCV